MASSRPRRFWLVLAIAWMASAVALAAPPSLTRLVPADAGLCLTLEDAAAHGDLFLASPQAARLREFPPLAKWRATNGPALQRIATDASRQLGVEVDDLWRHVFGRQTLLAVWPPSEPGMSQGPGLLLVEADDAAVLARFVGGLRAAQERAGDVLESRMVRHRELEYEDRRMKRDQGEVRIFLAVLNRIGVLATHENLIQRVLDLHLARDAAETQLIQLPTYERALEQIDPAAPAKLFLNPRSWDAAMTRGLPAQQQPLGAGQQLVVESWRSLEFAVFAFSLHPQARVEGYLAFDLKGEANPLSEVLGTLSGPAVLLEHIPANALAAAAGSLDIPRLLRWAQTREHPAGKQRQRGLPEIAWSLVDGTFQGIGPAFAGYLVAPPADSEFPVAAAAGMQIQQRAPVQPENALKPTDALRSLLQAAVALTPPGEGQPLPQLKTLSKDGTEILTLVDLRGAPPGVAPSFAFGDRTLFVGTLPAAVEQAVRSSADRSLAKSPQFGKLLGPRLQSPTHVSYADLAGLRRWLTVAGDQLATLLTDDKEEAAAKARQGWEQLTHVLKLADHAAAAAQFEATGLRVTASVSVEE